MVEIIMPDLCKCGHTEHCHLWGICSGCSTNNHEFVIDNLYLIEKLAKEKGLV